MPTKPGLMLYCERNVGSGEWADAFAVIRHVEAVEVWQHGRHVSRIRTTSGQEYFSELPVAELVAVVSRVLRSQADPDADES